MTGDELRALREESGLTQEELGQALGKVAAETICRYEKGKLKITDQKAQSFRNFFALRRMQNRGRRGDSTTG